MNQEFKTILNATVSVIENLPMEVPQEGILAGFVHPLLEGRQLLRKDDNLHYPMGRAFYKFGVVGIAEKAALSSEKEDKTELQKELLRGISVTYHTLSAYLERYALVVSKAAGQCEEEERERLEKISFNLSALSQNPPATFCQAVQLFYLMWCIRCQDACGCIGRLDQHLKPFYEADLQAGRITKQEAYDIIFELFEKLNLWGSGDTLMNVMVGGKNADGSDASSDLSVMMLEACAHTGKTEPHINVRYHKNIRKDVMQAAYRLQYLGYGQATIYNDEVIVPSMISKNIKPEYACQYANDGCTEIVWDGLGRIDFNHIDAVATLELAMNNGAFLPKEVDKVRYYHAFNEPVQYTPDVITGFESGLIEECQTFDEFYQMFLAQYDRQILHKLDGLRGFDQHIQTNTILCLPFLNGTFEEVLESGVGVINNGLPLNSYMVFLGSIPSVADSLQALKTVVYDKKYYTAAQVKEGMQANFEGFEAMRAELLDAPKFGNDIDSVDYLAADIVSHCCDYIDDYCQKNDIMILPALIGWRFVEEAYSICASADGRRVKEPIAEHYCATPGKALKGVTALVNSVSKAPLARAIGVAATHLSLPRNFARTEQEGVALLQTINEACLEKGLMQFNIAIYDAELLKEAQKHPLEHQDLIVRVWGFSARFVDLGEEMQNHIIQRTISQ